MQDEKMYEIVKNWHDRESDISLRLSMREVMKVLESDMRKSCAKESGVGDIAKGANKIIKLAKEGVRENLKGMWKSGDYWCVCDTFRAVRFKDKMPLEELSGNEVPIDLDRIFASHIKRNAVEITLPDMADLKVWDKTHKRVKMKHSNRYQQDPYLLDASIPLYVDIKFLISMMECLPNAKVTTGGTSQSALYFEAENGDGILMPTRKLVNSHET